MRRALILSAALLATPVFAQDKPGFFDRLFGTDEAQTDEAQGGMLERFIEDNLSGEGRTVAITGFAGALSGRATMDSLTISDADGVWLTVTDAVLDWNRTALFRGSLDVSELSAKEILLPRRPLPAGSEAPTPEASGFSLPELPVSVTIEKIAAERVSIGQPVFGSEAEVSAGGSLSLEGGEGTAALEIAKLDGSGGLTLDAGYTNASGVLKLDLALEEATDGIFANMVKLPGRPSVSFGITGEAPVDAFAADIRLATDGLERLTGRVETSRPGGAENPDLRIALEIGGDIAPVFAADYQPFFGPDVALRAVVDTHGDGSLSVSDLNISAEALRLAGAAEIGADGMPREIRLNGEIARGGAPVLLPLPGVETRVEQVLLDVAFDAADGDAWTGRFDIRGLDRPGFSAATMRLTGNGRIASAPSPAVSASFDFEATRLDLGDPRAAEALGEEVTGSAEIDWFQGAPLRITSLALDGESYGLTGRAEVAFAEAGPDISGTAEVRADRLSAFSGLAGRTLGGSARLSTRFDMQPLAGTFDIGAEGTTNDLILSQAEADRILAGTARLDVSAVRDATGIRATLTTLESPNASVTGQAALKSGGSSLSMSGSLADAALVLPAVSGPVRMSISADEDENRIWAWSTEMAMEGTRLTAKGTAIDIYRNPVVAVSGRLEADDLSDFAELARRPLAGAIATDFTGEAAADLSRASVTLTGTATDLKTGRKEADGLLRGKVDFDIDGAMAGNVFTLRDSSVEGPEIALRADGTLIPEAGRFAVEGRLTDPSLLLTGAPAGPLTFRATGQQSGADWTIDAGGEGAGLDASVAGTLSDPLGKAAFEGRVAASAEDLSVLSELAGRTLGGAISVDAEGLAEDMQRFDLTVTATGRNVRIGQPEADRILAGDLNAVISAARDGGLIDLRTLSLGTDLLEFSGSGALGSEESTIDLDARLADIAPFATGFSGPLNVTGTVGQNGGGRYTVDIAASGPAGSQAKVAGLAAPDFGSVDLTVNGTAPLGLADRFIAPRSVAGTVGFDLTVNGPPVLSSVSGTVTSAGARFVDPTIRTVLNGLALTARLAGGRADLSANAAVDSGGTLSVSGPVTLTAPYPANLQVSINGVVLSDARIYETSLDGRASVEGPLAGGARIAADIGLGETNIRIPSSGLGGGGEVPDILHLNERPPVRATRERAGFANGTGEKAGLRPAGPAYPLDIRVSAPRRIFVRGRGLDAEFGGMLHVTGTTTNAIPDGAFNLIRGRLDILGQRLNIEEAAISIQGDFVPVLRIRATTQADEYTINVNVIGPADNPEITFTSEPELPQEEVLARMIFGRGLDTLSPIQAARLALAVRTLAGKGGEGVVGNIRQGAGLADLDVTTDEEGNTAVQAGAYLGENLYTDVTLGSGGTTELNLNLDVSRSVTVKGSVTNEGETSIGIFYERDY